MNDCHSQRRAKDKQLNMKPSTQGELVQLIVDRPQLVTPGTG